MTEEREGWGDWAYENRHTFSLGLSVLVEWLAGKVKRKPVDEGETTEEETTEGQISDERGALILGPGGVGKSTFGKLLSGKYDPLLDLPGAYDESLEIEHYPIPGSPGLEILVPPGQKLRRESTWGELLKMLSLGMFRGVILVGAYGYHNHELGHLTSYKEHPLFKTTKEAFLIEFLENRRAEELKVVQEIVPYVTPRAGQKFWFISLVTKQDLWIDDKKQVQEFYSSGQYAQEIERIKARLGSQSFRYEFALTSLVISNFVTGKGEVLKPNTEGYDQLHQAQSLRLLFQKLDSVRRWEAEQ